MIFPRPRRTGPTAQDFRMPLCVLSSLNSSQTRRIWIAVSFTSLWRSWIRRYRGSCVCPDARQFRPWCQSSTSLFVRMACLSSTSSLLHSSAAGALKHFSQVEGKSQLMMHDHKAWSCVCLSQVTMIKALHNRKVVVKQVMIRSRFGHDESVVLHLVYSGCYDRTWFHIFSRLCLIFAPSSV